MNTCVTIFRKDLPSLVKNKNLTDLLKRGHLIVLCKLFAWAIILLLMHKKAYPWDKDKPFLGHQSSMNKEGVQSRKVSFVEIRKQSMPFWIRIDNKFSTISCKSVFTKENYHLVMNTYVYCRYQKKLFLLHSK